MNQIQNTMHKAALEMLKKFNNRLNRSQMEPEDKLSSWATYLVIERSFTIKQVAFALDKLMSSNVRFMPSAYEIADVLSPKHESSEDRSEIIVEEIMRAAQWFGYMRINEAFLSLSAEAKAAAMSPNFLLEVCNTPIEQGTALRAQIRKRAKASLESKKTSSENARLEQIGISPDGMKAVGFNGFLPEV